MLSVHEINRLMENKRREKLATYEKIYEQCQKRILKYATNDKYRCFFEVPEFILGLPVFNINSVTLYVIEKLTQSGFMVKYYFPKHLYISWDLDEISGKKPQFGRIENVAPKLLQPPPRLSLMNKQPSFPPPPVPTRTINKNDNIIMPDIPSFDLPFPKSTFANDNHVNSKFVKSIAQFKPSGKFAINI
jgi:hypothetical protein